MDLPEYYLHDPESYSELFKTHAEKLVGLMKIMDEEIVAADLPPVGRPKDLFRMVLDLSYQVDRAFKRKHSIKEPDLILSTYMTKDELKADLKNIFIEEFNRFLSIQNENSK